MFPELIDLPIGELELDKDNPRIQLALDMYGDQVTAPQMALALKEGSDDSDTAMSTYNRLKKSIIKHGGIISPVIVNVRDGNNVCVEGNTRLLIYRELKNEAGDNDSDWDTIPCLVYQQAPSRQMEAIRLQAHLVGPRQWNPYAKARYLKRLWDEENLTYDEIIEYCGGNAKQIQANIDAYNLAENVYRQLVGPDQFDHTRFSGFVEYQDPKIRNSVYDNGFDDKDFSSWLHERKIVRLEDVRALPKIFKDEQAKKVFLQEDSREARKELDSKSDGEVLRNSDLEMLLNTISIKIGELSYDDVERYRGDMNFIDAVTEAKLYIEQLSDDLNLMTNLVFDSLLSI